MPTSPRTSRRLRALGLVLLVFALTAISSPVAAGRVLERRTGPSSHLLATDKMPTAGEAWSSTATVTDDLSVLGPCHLFSLVDIGALTAVRRTWTSTSATPRAVQIVARFADGRSAWRAHQVLGSWQEACAGDDLDVSAMRTVSVAIGNGNAYRVSRGTRATDVGILRKGSWISVVAVVAPSSQVPADSALARAAVKRIAATF